MRSTTNSSPPNRPSASVSRSSASDCAQHFIARLVADAVVNALEVIDVNVHAGQGIALAPAASDFLYQAPLHVAPVVDPGERIGHADVLESFVVDHIFEADSNDGSRVLDEVGGHAARKTGLVEAADAQAADQPPLPCQGHDDHACRGDDRLRE